MNFAVGHNMPDYLPESDVFVTDDFEHAKNVLMEDMSFSADRFYGSVDIDKAQEIDEAIAEVSEWASPDTIYAGGLAWWIGETDEQFEVTS